MIRFLAELAGKTNAELHLTPSKKTAPLSDKMGIYEIDISPYPPESYWTDWGGWYDNFSDTQILLYFGQYLHPVFSIKDLIDDSFSIHLDVSDKYVAYINIPQHPWLYPSHMMETDSLIPFLSSALHPDNPSDNKIRDVNASVRFETPSFTSKLSGGISGVTLNQSFGAVFFNNDGYFDNDNYWGIFNTPIIIKKTSKENPKYSDFKYIRVGMVENTAVDMETFTVNAADKMRSMNEPVCNIIKQEYFPEITIADEAIGKAIPVIYGTKTTELTKLANNKYIACEYLSDVEYVVDKNGQKITSPPFTTDGVISCADAKVARVTGYPITNMGEIITNILIQKSNIRYSDSNWNRHEVNRYINIAPHINICFKNGDVNSAVQTILKNDMAYFIQQNDGRFSIRKYGQIYNSLLIPSWATTQKPKKDFLASQKNYISSVIITYDYTGDGEYKTFYYDATENEAESRYRKKLRGTFNTELIDNGDVQKLAMLLTERFSEMRQTISIGVGVDTSEIELLDTVMAEIKINERNFSETNYFTVTEINPAQDIIVLEETSPREIEISGEYPHTQNSDYDFDYDNLYATSDKHEYLCMVDGGGV